MPSLTLSLFGATGRFGKCIARLALQDPLFQLRSAVAHPASPQLGKDLGELLGIPSLGLPIASKAEPASVWIDVSLPSAAAQNISSALAEKIPLVLGTTGLSKSDFEQIRIASREIPIFYAPNFSLGMALLRKMAAMAARRFPSEAWIDIVETHHAQKRDAPSGAALLLAQEIRGAHPQNKDAQIHSLRSGHVVGEHTILFNTAEEKLTLSHEAHSREAFAQGALAAAKFLAQKPRGLYGMDDLLDENSSESDH